MERITKQTITLVLIVQVTSCTCPSFGGYFQLDDIYVAKTCATLVRPVRLLPWVLQLCGTIMLTMQ